VIGRHLKNARKERGYSQALVAKALGLSPSSIAKIEAGTRKEEFSVICRMLALYEIDSAKFIFRFTGESLLLKERANKLQRGELTPGNAEGEEEIST
jgi:transcriptional regulator with XRE-family HTH domain